MDAMKIANSIPMWLACALPVAFVILQAVLFARGAYKSGKKLGLNDKQMKKAMKSSAVTSIGPSIVVLSAMLSLLVSVGGPIGWMRLSMIGSVMFESIAAGLGTSAVGVQLGTDTRDVPPGGFQEEPHRRARQGDALYDQQVLREQPHPLRNGEKAVRPQKYARLPSREDQEAHRP